MKRLLVVSPHFPPVNAADMHRVRMVLPFLRENGWIAEVLAVAPDAIHAPLDAWLEAGLPPEIDVHRARALGKRWARIPGLGGLGWRSIAPLARAGDRLLAANRFDLVYFSTTVFEVHALGPRWKHKFGVPFVMDYQDPWVNDYYRDRPDVPPPGGRLKFFAADLIHRLLEPRVLRHCAGVTSVSPEYPESLARRYAWWHPKVLVQPFPGSRRDFERLGTPADSGSSETLDWVYVGRGGPDMGTALRSLFRAVRLHGDPDPNRRLRLSFVGTSYAPAGRGSKSVTKFANEIGVGAMVDESPDRVPYREALMRLRNADALIVPGSDDPSYTASKIYPYLLAGKPLLAIFHEKSTVVDLMRKVGGGVCVTFRTGEEEESIAARIAASWLNAEQWRHSVPLHEDTFAPYTDQGSAAMLCRFFETCVGTR